MPMSSMPSRFPSHVPRSIRSLGRLLAPVMLAPMLASARDAMDLRVDATDVLSRRLHA